MKRKILMLIIRLIRFFHKEDEFIPFLASVPEGKIVPGRLYRHYGRILASRKNTNAIQFKYYYCPFDGNIIKTDSNDAKWVECSYLRYMEAQQNTSEITRYEAYGKPCSRCACQTEAIPCCCGFAGGTMSGYFELVYKAPQFSNNPTI